MLSKSAFNHSLRCDRRSTCHRYCSPLSRSSLPHFNPSCKPGRPFGPTIYRKPKSLVLVLQSSGDVAETVEDRGASPKIGVLFVCLGNICRSPTAEAMFRTVVQRNGLEARFDIDSCGTGGGSPDWYKEGGWSYHEGDASDARMTATARRRGVTLTSRSRPLVPADLTRFEYIIGMDPKNIRAIKAAGAYWVGREAAGKLPAVPADYESRVSLMTEYCVKYPGAAEVPDPYYGGPEGFEKVLDLLDDASQGLLDAISQAKGLK